MALGVALCVALGVARGVRLEGAAEGGGGVGEGGWYGPRCVVLGVERADTGTEPAVEAEAFLSLSRSSHAVHGEYCCTYVVYCCSHARRLSASSIGTAARAGGGADGGDVVGDVPGGGAVDVVGAWLYGGLWSGVSIVEFGERTVRSVWNEVPLGGGEPTAIRPII